MTDRASLDRWLTDAEVRSQAPARREIPDAMAGRAKIVLELVEGRARGDSRATPLNPQGKVGADLSGPPWGSALRQPIAWCSGRKADTASVVDHDPLIGTVAKNTAGITVPKTIGPWMIWVRPFEQLHPPQHAPFSRGYVVIRAHGTASENVSLKTKFWNLTRGEDPADTPADTQTLAMTVNETHYDLDYFVNLLPGLNVIRGVFVVETDNKQISINSICLHQKVKRSH